MEDTQAFIRDEIKRLNKKRNVHRAPRVSAQSLPKTKPQKRNFMSTFLATAIVLMMVATLGGMVFKRGLAEDTRTDKNVAVHVNPRPDTSIHTQPPVVPSTQYMTAAEGRELTDKVADMDDKMKIWIHRQWLLGLAVNENSAISKDIDRRYHGNRDSGFITFDEQWKMNKLPESMRLTPEQRDSIRNGPK